MSSGCNPDDVTQSPSGRNLKVRAEQIRLLYANAGSGVTATVAVSAILAYLQWDVVAHATILWWLGYTYAIAAARFVLTRLYWRSSANFSCDRWGTAFAAGAGLSGIGWGSAAWFLYPPGYPVNQLLLVFVLGGMILGAVSLLAVRLEAFLSFIVPIAVPVAMRFFVFGDNVHLAMGLLAALFTVNILITTWNMHLTIRTSLNLQFDNKNLLSNLLAAKKETEALNRDLETRVAERTTELHAANERLRDEIEQRKQAEEELLRARKLESLGVLVGGIAHDFNNFLTIVLGNIGLASMELKRGNPVFDILSQTEKACRRAASLASQLLTFGKGGAPVRQIASLTPLVRDAASLTAAGSNVTMHLDLAEDLPAVNIDSSQVSHALQNVLLNARQAMPQGGTIDLRTEAIVHLDNSLPLKPGRYVKISVRDRGCGIPPEILPRIFDPYFTTKKTGTGLGLAAAYAIIAKHHGHISVQSTVGVETVFTIYLPASEQKPAPDRPAREELPPGTGKILVMDDEDSIRMLAVRMLAKLGYEASGARDGAEAIAALETARDEGKPFDAMLLDLTIPGGMGGKEAAARLKELDPLVTLVVSSGYSDDPVLSDYRSYGFDAVLSKPWTVAQLSQLFKQILQSGTRSVKA